MATRQFGLDYIDKPSAAKADYSWRLYVAGYLAAPTGLLYLLLPHDDPTSWAWIAVGGACLLVAVGIGVVETLRTTQSQEGNVTLPFTTMVLTLAQFDAILAVDMGVTPSTGVLRWLLLIPTLIAAALGNGLMFAIVATTSLSMMVVVQVGAGLSAGQMGAEVLAAVFLVAMFRIFAVRVVAAFARDILFANMSEVAATVDSLDDGWTQMLPAVGAFLEATDVIIARIDADGVHPIASWPGNPPDEFDDIADQLSTGFAMSNEVVQASGCIVIPVAVTSGPRIVAVVVGAKHRVIVDMYLQSRANQVAQQLGVLVNRIQMIEGLELLTRTDSLTGLPNRRALMERLAVETSGTRHLGASLCAVMMDLDHFKSYNDQFGHLEGDRALETVATFMSSRIRGHDMVSRYGGEEFALVLPNTDVAGALELLEELRCHISRLDLCRPLTISAGIACWDHGATSETLLSNADHALYQAKASGRDQCRVWDEASIAADSWESEGNDVAGLPSL